MRIIEAIILGIVQGITEWLPISSSGHLVLLQNLFKIEQPVIFDLILHLGSLLVVLIVFREDIKKLVIGVFRKEKEYINLLFKIIIATIPIALVGFLLKEFIEKIFNDLRVVGFSFLFTSILLFLSKYPKVKDKELNYKNSFIIGLVQVLALLPGLSRSGSTISAGLMQGVKNEEIAKFSFLLFIPAILGATSLEIKNVNLIDGIFPLVIGVLTVVIVGFISLKLLLYIVKNSKIYLFGYYCLFLGLITLGIYYL
ncbi:undecaprenyl-diphosphate phosphatase [Candidatus Woesearchaeota archaeon]|nr:undecaprenyl-diphosphate phosphatase [Candidatus Woesearchaeota archaeon]